VAILFADSFDSYYAGTNIYDQTVGTEGLIAAGYEMPSRLPYTYSGNTILGYNGYSAVVCNFSANERKVANIGWQIGTGNVIGISPEGPFVGLKRKFNNVWTDLLVLNTKLKINKAHTASDSATKIPLIIHGPVTIYVDRFTSPRTSLPSYNVYVNDSASVAVLEDTVFYFIQVEVNKRDGVYRLWINNKKVYEAAATDFDVFSYEILGIVGTPSVNGSALQIVQNSTYLDKIFVDFLVLNDGSGLANNARLTKHSVTTLAPQQDITTDFSVTSGTHFSAVSNTFNSNVTFDAGFFATSTVVGAKDQYALTTKPALTPLAVGVLTVAKMSEPDTYEIAPLITYNGVEVEGNPIALRVNRWTAELWLFNNDPAGNPWTADNILNLSWGPKLLDSNKSAMLVNGGFDYLLYGADGTVDVYRVPDPSYVAPPDSYNSGSASALPASGPGPQTLVGGTVTAGFYGELAASEIISSVDLCTLVNFTGGQIINSDPGWVKVSSQGKTLFIAKRSIRQSNAGVNISMADLVNANLVYGNKTVTINGYNYIIRLLTGATSDPYTASGGEYDSVIYPIVQGSPAAAPYAPYLPADLGIATGEGFTCQETYSGTLLTRGRSSITEAVSYPYLRWRPVLELVGPA
jgi:hypothetical protein